MDQVDIICPHCGFTKSVEHLQIPKGTKNVTCPKCQQYFILGDAPGTESLQSEFVSSPQAARGTSQTTPLQKIPVNQERNFTTVFESRFCSTCGRKIHVKAEVCPKCGVRVAPPPGAINKVALLLITFAFGGLGGHKFYQKRYLLGVLYLLFFWTCIPNLAAFIEFIIYACKSETELQRKYPEAGGAGVVLAIVIPIFAIASIGIIAAIAIPQFSAYREKAFNSAASSDLKSCKTQTEAYFADHQTYPTEAGQMQCNPSTDVALYYLSLGPGENQIISYHDRGNKAFLNHSNGTEIVEYAKEEMKGQIEEEFGATALERTFYFIE